MTDVKKTEPAVKIPEPVQQPTPATATGTKDVSAEITEEEQRKKTEEDVRRRKEEAEKHLNEREKEAKEIAERASVILQEYGGLEANIPTSNEYWGLMNTYRTLVARR